MDGLLIRLCTEADVAGVNRIYNREVREGVATWELDEWPDARRLDWLRERDDQEPVLVAQVGSDVAGFAYLTKYRGRRGYQYTRENTIFLDAPYQRRGIGRLLLEALIERARALGMHSLLAFIDTENEGSIALHRRLGYREIGTERETGYKFGAWRSTVEMQLLLEGPRIEGRGDVEASR